MFTFADVERGKFLYYFRLFRFLIVMNFSFGEQSNRFKLGVMTPLETQEKSEKIIKAGRSSFSSIPPVDLSKVLSQRAQQKNVEPIVPQIENLCDSLCNSYKFVVNYGVFEPNFEWLPLEVGLSVKSALLNGIFLENSSENCEKWL